MRRANLASSDRALFDELVNDVAVGYLSLSNSQGAPRSIALNFVALGQDIYFHGALAGEKCELLQSSPAAGFTIVKEYSYIPSHWSAPKFACPATQFFKSVEVKGVGEVVSDNGEKALALQALMVKYQPEGHYDPVEVSDPGYAKALSGVGVFRVRCDTWTGKVKLGQSEPKKLRHVLVEKLRERGGPHDEATAREIEKSFLSAD